jgi:glycosyltransferase involved in cell wall biosynthesis
MNEDVFLSVVAPAFNEEENIEKIIKYWNSILESADFPSEIVITDDGSTDETLNILARLKKEIPRLKVVNHDKNYGYGRAMSSAVKYSSGKWVVTIDSDGQFDLKEYKLLLEKIQEEELDGVTGYRKKKQDTFIRVLADRILNRIVRLLFGVKFKDTNCALKLIKGEFMRQIDIEARGYPAPTEIVIKLSMLGARLGEIGISHIEREGGLSKLKPILTGINFLKFLLYLRKKIILYKKKIINRL